MVGMTEPDETLEEKVVTREVPETARGLRLALSLTFAGLGIGLVVVGVLVAKAEVVRVALILGGKMPAKQGDMPPKHDDRPSRQRDGPGSG